MRIQQIAAAAALGLLLWGGMPVFAEEVPAEDTSFGAVQAVQQPDGVPPEEVPPTDEPTQIATFEELAQWLTANKNTGAKAELTADLQVDAQTSYQFLSFANAKTLSLEFGDHTIFVAGELTLCPYLSISGRGGEDGLFAVKKGGRLILDGITLTAEEGNAITQEAGGIVAYHGEGETPFLCEGALPQGLPAVAIPVWGENDPLPYALLPAQKLPATVEAYVYEEGTVTQKQLPVTWDTTVLAQEKRTMVTGEWQDGVLPFRATQPRCLAVFPKAGAPVFLNCMAESGGRYLFMEVHPGTEQAVYRLEWSKDGKSWSSLQDVDGSTEKTDPLEWYCQLEEDALPAYFSVVQEKDGAVCYSDTLYVSESGDAESDIGGGRGGEVLPEKPDHPRPSFRPDKDEDESVEEEPPAPEEILEEPIQNITSAPSQPEPPPPPAPPSLPPELPDSSISAGVGMPESTEPPTEPPTELPPPKKEEQPASTVPIIPAKVPEETSAHSAKRQIAMGLALVAALGVPLYLSLKKE